jgi:hypothetical protein
MMRLVVFCGVGMGIVSATIRLQRYGDSPTAETILLGATSVVLAWSLMSLVLVPREGGGHRLAFGLLVASILAALGLIVVSIGLNGVWWP